jgi:hypothetical protein
VERDVSVGLNASPPPLARPEASPKERWEEAPDRLHEGRLFTHNGGGWSAQLLAP